MNSYPVELLVQHAPLMFVAGLEVQPSEPSTSPQVRGLTLERRGSAGQESRDPFLVLTGRLRKAFASRRRGAIWDANKSKSFNVVLVDKAVRLPPRKVVPTTRDDDPASAAALPRSPLSPLNPSSPLYPDGMIAPIWVRKHIELVPSVFVLVMRLWEVPPPASPLEVHDTSQRDEERARDLQLAAEIGARKKVTTERNIKLTVILMASRHMLDDPSLDARLSLIRRQSGLDTRAALFVLSPLSSAELNDFIESLQEALFESAVEYYGFHTKRVRRKKNRFTHQAAPLPPGSGPSTGRPLRNEGWIVRYEYKMATFAEFRMEKELARKHFEDCWDALCEMFQSTAIMPPRTKRWAEAKVLADSVSFKICKLYLYESEFTRSVTQFNRHVRHFTELSRNWGIAQNSYEFWAWLARQYRLFGEILEFATRSGIVLPTTASSVSSHPPTHLPSASLASLTEGLNVPFGINPANSIQHAGYYFYAAAQCTQQRFDCYISTSNQEDISVTSSPVLANEQKVDHQSIIIELYSKSYEIFKAQEPANERLNFQMAYRIAETYYNAHKYDLGAKFFERIARTYRREHWDAMLKPILTMWCECTRQLNDPEGTVRLLIELLGLDIPEDEASALEDELVEVLSKSPPPSGPVILEPSEINSILKTSIAFWQGEVFVGEPASFQLSLVAARRFRTITFSALHVYWSESETPIIIEHVKGSDNGPAFVNLGSVTTSSLNVSTPITADLRWTSEMPRVFSGNIVTSQPANIQITRLVLVLIMNGWNITIPISVTKPDVSLPINWLASRGDSAHYIPIKRQDAWSCRVGFRPHILAIAFEHAEPAYIGELYAVIVRVENTDTQDFEIDVDILMQPSDEDSISTMTMESESSTSLIKGVQFGVLTPGQVVYRTLFLQSSGAPGDRVVDFSVQSRSKAFEVDSIDLNETLRTLTIPMVAPIRLSPRMSYSRNSAPLPPLFDPARLEPDFFHTLGSASLIAELESCGPWDIVVESIKIIPADVPRVRLASSTLSSSSEDFPCMSTFLHTSEPPDEREFIAWAKDDTYCIALEAEFSIEDEPSDSPKIDFPAELEVIWKRISSSADTPSARMTFQLPALQPPDDSLIAMISCPPSATLHQPITLLLSVQNRQPFRTADVVLDVDSSEAFVLAGPRHARLTTLLPGTSEQIRYNLIPLLTGVVRLPTFRLLDQRPQPGARATESVSGLGDGSQLPAGKHIQVVMAGRDSRVAEDSELYNGQEEHVRQHHLLVHPY